MNVAEAIREAVQMLRAAGVPEPQREARSLLAPAVRQDQAFLITHSEDPLASEALAVFRDWTARRAGGEPLQYITGHQEFFGLDFEVNQAVLIPRPETELLVETALELIPVGPQSPLICDVGTGSGCIIISLLSERQSTRGVAVDISPAALQVARQNATQHQVGERMTFVAADGFTAFQKNLVRFDQIVTNPPYVADRDFPDLQREVRQYEPRVALTSGADGLSMIRRLLNEAPPFLFAGGHLILEIGYDQLAAVEQLIDPRVWKLVAVRSDLQGIPRTMALQRLS